MNEQLNEAPDRAHINRAHLFAVGAGLFATVLAFPTMAYVGPGAGLGILGALLAVIIATLATIVGLVLWPMRFIARRWKTRRQAEDQAPPSGEARR